MRKPVLTTLLLGLTLCGCSASKVIDLYTDEYRDTTASAGDSQLLLNILRAKDGQPIHFYDLSIIHGSLQSTAGATGTIPFPLINTLTAPAVAPTLTLQSSPTFDIGTSDTQDFTRGILSALDPDVVKALFDQGVNPRIMMLLFFSEYRFPNGTLLLNTTACDPSDPGKRPEIGCYYQIYKYLGKINERLSKATHAAGLIAPFEVKVRANVYSALQPVGGRLSGAWTLGNLGDLRQLDATQYRRVNNQLYSISGRHLAICFEDHHTLRSLFPEQYPDSACTHSEIVEYGTKRRPGLSLRSTYEIIQFLGQVLRYQEEADPGHCLVVYNVTEEKRLCESGDVLFQVNAPNGTPVIGTRYAGGWYTLSDRPCRRRWQENCDYSLQVLAILEMLINENKQAKDIVAIPRVQAVQ